MLTSLVEMLRPLRFRGKVRLLSPLLPAAGTYTGKIYGSAVPLDVSDYVQRMVYLGCFEAEESRIVERALKPGMTFVDVGANVGYFTFLAAQRVGAGGRVLAVEPSPVLFPKLQEAVRQNRLHQVIVEPVGLGRETGRLDLYAPPAELHNHAPTMVPTEGWTPVQVPVETLDILLDRHKISRVDCLKIDVEGFEGAVLEGATESLAAGRVRSILCEFNVYWLRQVGTEPDALWDRILGHGFRPEGTASRPDFEKHGLSNHFFRLAK